jgi:acyl dehydratase
MLPIENRPFAELRVGEEERLVHVLTREDFSLLTTQAATIGAGIVDPMVAATRTFAADSTQSAWASALMSALIAGRLPGAGSKLIRQTVETSAPVAPGDVMTIVARVMAKEPEGQRVTIEVRASNQRGELAMAASAEIAAPKKTIVAEPRDEYVKHLREKGRRYKILIERTSDLKALKTAVVHPVDEASLIGAIERRAKI